MDGSARPFGSGLEPESTGSRCWGEEEEKMTSMMRHRRWTGHPRKSSEARRCPYSVHSVSGAEACQVAIPISLTHLSPLETLDLDSLPHP